MSVAPKSQKITAEFIEIMHRGKLVHAPIAQVSHFVAEDKYVTAHTDTGELLLAAALTQLRQLFGDRVVLVHRKRLVFRNRIAAVSRINRDTGGTAILTNGQELQTSRRYTNDFFRKSKGAAT